ncbi:8686_t:CDS:2 [Diversispora eburnea]|uniref:8686_t:CDS:1 n=1 Tax=Diversispora eburnea TaxID=1213867 RepID=A0A9N8VPZ8_9GLOM|nr:8686_t:CDS:2 [Diversispora eburnea]
MAKRKISQISTSPVPLRRSARIAARAAAAQPSPQPLRKRNRRSVRQGK